MNRSVPPRSHQLQSLAHRPALALFATAVLTVTGLAPAEAEEVLDYLPEDALGFVLIRDLGETSERLIELAHSMGLPLPEPLEYFKFATGIRAGLDNDGDLLVALVPGARRIDPPEPMVLLPISNYDDFSASIKADPSGKIDTVKIADEEILVARQGPFAMLMNVEHRETLQVITTLEPSPVELLEPWAEWLADTRLTFVVMPEGRNRIRQESRNFFSKSGGGGTGLQDGLLGDPAIAGFLAQLRQGAPAYQAILEGLLAEFEMVGYGLDIDEKANIRFGKRAIHNSDFELDKQSSAKAQLAGFGEGTFLFAGGTAIPDGVLEKLIRGYSRVQQSAPELWDLADLSTDQWQMYEEASVLIADRIKSIRLFMTPGEEEEPLISNIFGVLQVDNADLFLQLYKKQIAVRNQILAQSTSDIRLKWEFADATIADHPAVEEVLDVAAAAADPDLPIFNWMIEATLGGDGKLKIAWVQTGDDQIVFGICDPEDLVEFIQKLSEGESGLSESDLVETTRALLPKKSAGQWFVSPHGCVAWVNRAFDELLEPVFGLENPQFSLGESPPVGLTLDFPKNQIVTEIVWPAELTRAVLAQ